MDDNETRIGRRAFLWGAALSALPLASGTEASARRALRWAPPGGRIMRQREPENLEMDFSSVDTPLTPTERFYIRSHFATPQIEARVWRLRVEGAGSKPLELTYDDLLKMPARTVTVTLECAGNGRVYLIPAARGVQWEQGAVGTAIWTGVRLADVLKRATDADTRRTVGSGLGMPVEVILEGADSGEIREPPRPAGAIHFARSLPLAKAYHEDTLLAYRMNGKELSPAHGFPVRAIVPGWYGMASVKWLTRILVTPTPFQGYYQTVDYALWEQRDGLPVRVPITQMQVKASIARPAHRESVPAGGMVRIAGAAWAGEADIAKVEVSTDGGQTWAAARLQGRPIRYAWRLWDFDWRVPRAGKHTLMARATDASGRRQPLQRDQNRENYLINHIIPVDVEAR